MRGDPVDGSEIKQSRRWGEPQPAFLEINIRNNRLHERHQRDPPISPFDFQQIVAGADQISDGADGWSLDLKSDAETNEVEQVEFTVVQWGTVMG